MDLKKLLAAAAVFLAVSCMKWIVPDFAEQAIPTLHQWISRQQVVLYLPVKVIAWLGLG